MIELRLLGPPRLTIDGDAVNLALKPLTVLACLAAHRGRTIGLDRLGAELWGDHPPASRANTLEGYVSRLRGVLEPDRPPRGPSAIRREPSGYRWQDRDVWLDADAFAAEVGRARTLRGSDAEAAVKHYTEALERWSGDALEGLTLGPLLGETATRWQTLRLDAEEERLALELALGRVGDVVERAQTLLAAHPYRERFAELSMRALTTVGRQRDALECYRTVRDTLVSDLGIEPGRDLQAMHQRILRQEPLEETPQPLPTLGGVAPAPVEQPIGREDELAAVVAAVDTTRCVTVSGPGGAGKTTVAIAAAATIAPRLADGARVVAFDGVGARRDVAGVAAEQLALGPHPGGSVAALRDALRERECLLVLDGCERLAEATAAVVDDLLRLCPRLRILVTSRMTLDLVHEHVVRVGPLPTPDPRDDPVRIRRSPAVALLVRRARQVRAGFDVDDRVTATVADIVTRLDGLPLAIELAAFRLVSREPHELADTLDEHLSSRARRGNGHAIGNGTLDTVIADSERLLSDPHRRAFRRLAVFPDGCTRAAAAAVTGLDGADLDHLVERLVGTSLVSVRSVAGTTRLRMLGTIRTYAHRRLAEHPDEHDAATLLALRHCAAIVEADMPATRSRDAQAATNRLGCERDTVAALIDAAETPAAVREARRLAATWWWWWFAVGGTMEGLRRLERLLEQGPSSDPLTHARLETGLAHLVTASGDPWRGYRLAERALVTLRQAEDSFEYGATLLLLGNSGIEIGRTDDAEHAARSARQHAARTGDPWLFDCAGNVLATVRLDTGRLEEARALAAAVYERHAPDGDPWTLTWSRWVLARVAAAAGDSSMATEHYLRTLEFTERSGHVLGSALTMFGLAHLAVCEGDPARAARLVGAVRSRLGSAAMAPTTCMGPEHRAIEAALARALPASLRRQREREGRGLEPDQLRRYCGLGSS